MPLGRREVNDDGEVRRFVHGRRVQRARMFTDIYIVANLNLGDEGDDERQID